MQDIVVQGRTAEAVDRFVAALTQTQRGRQLARWNAHICPKVLGIEAARATFLINRIGAVARSLHVPVGGARCGGNVIIVVTDDADNFTQLLVRRHPRLFRDRSTGMASPSEIARLLEPRPIRWIAASRTGNADGGLIVDGQNRTYSASRITMSTRENAALTIFIVDADRLQTITWRQLGDFLSLASLARPSMEADYDGSTIMSIFQRRDRGERGPAGMTVADRRFLEALYSTNATVSAEAQRAGIRARMERTAESPATR